MTIYFLIFACKPAVSSKDVAGAYINSWIKALNITEAEEIARIRIRDANWIINNKEDAYEVTEGEYYEQALLDDWVLVIHTYPQKD